MMNMKGNTAQVTAASSGSIITMKMTMAMKFSECVDVVRVARHQPTDRGSVEVFERQSLEMREDVVANVDHCPLARHLGYIALEEVAQELEDEQADVDENNLVQALIVADENVVVDGNFREEWAGLPRDGCDEDQPERQRHPFCVRFEIAKQPKHQPCVERLFSDFFLVNVYVVV